MPKLASRLKQLRTDRQITQTDLARQLNVSQNAVFNWENGKREPSLDMIEKIANALKVSAQELLGYSDKEYVLYKAHSNISNVSIEIDTDETLVIDGVLIAERNLLKEYRELNNVGKKAAIERVAELKYIPGYTGDDGLPFK